MNYCLLVEDEVRHKKVNSIIGPYRSIRKAMGMLSSLTNDMIDIYDYLELEAEITNEMVHCFNNEGTIFRITLKEMSK